MSIAAKWFQHSQTWALPSIFDSILKFTLFFQQKDKVSARFGVKQPSTLHKGVKQNENQRF